MLVLSLGVCERISPQTWRVGCVVNDGVLDHVRVVDRDDPPGPGPRLLGYV